MSTVFVANPRTNDDFAANARAAREKVSLALGYPAAGPYDAEAMVRVADGVAGFIVANPGLFSTEQVETARRRTASDLFNQPLADTSIGAADFVRAYGETAGEFLEGAGAVAGRTASNLLGINLGTVLIVGGVVAILWFGAPYVLPKLKAVFAK